MRMVMLAVLLLPAVLVVAAQGASADERPMALEPLPENAEASRRMAGRVPIPAGRLTLPEVGALLEREAGVTVRFDWDGLAEVGVTPESSAVFEQGEDSAQRLLSMVLVEVLPDGARGGYPTYMLIDGTVVVGTNRSLVRLAPQVFWPQREEAIRTLGVDDRTMLQLQRIVTVNFDEIGIGPVIDYLRDTTGANVVVNWPALELVGIDQDTVVSFQLSRVMAGQMLDATLDQAGAENFDDDKPGYTIVEGIVYISTLADIRVTSVTVEVYDIRFMQDWLSRRELRAVYQDDPLAMELLSLDMETRQGGLPSWQEMIDMTIELIQDSVGSPDEWLDEDSTIRELNGNLIVKTQPASHREVAALLDRFADSMHRAQVDFVRELEVVRLLRRAEALRAQSDHASALALVEEALAVDPLYEPARALRLVLEQTIDRLEFRE